MQITLSHFEITVRDMKRMEDFYTRVLGLVVTDRSPPGEHEMVFLSAHPDEHHQIVLAAVGSGDARAGSIDHLAFRIDGLDTLRRCRQALTSDGCESVQAVSHGTTWSIYFRDPEGNRLELFVDTPWHVAQPLRFPIDLAMADDELIAWTRAQICTLPDFQPSQGWFERHRERLVTDDGRRRSYVRSA